MNRAAHSVATVALAGALVPLALRWPDGWLVAGGVAATLCLTPDLDQSRTPYGWARRHRGLSHWPVVGTVDRALWFLGPALAAWLATGREADWRGLALVLLGMCLSDALHAVLDSKRLTKWRDYVRIGTQT
jgi:membrane-bound metal-dependent hydrolase YbcI (DUF457 family)